MWRYGVGHSELELRSYTGEWSEFLQILFVGVRWIEIGRSFRGGITLTEVADSGQRAEVTNCPHPLLLTELRGREGEAGFVAASNLRIYRRSASGEEIDRLLVMNT